MPDTSRASRLAFWSILIAIGVMGIKFVAWWLSGSVALYSDALESIVNVIAALIAWWAIRISLKPPDDQHPFGHHKAEYLSAVVEGVLIVIAALLIFREAGIALMAGARVEEPGAGMAVNLLAAIINALWAWMLISGGREMRSPALVADGKHILTDVVTSVGVLVGLCLVILTGWTILDPVMAIIVGLNVLREGWRIIGASVDGLMDRAVEEDEAERIRATILAHAGGANEIHDLKTRSAGRTIFIEFHLVVDGGMNVATSHAICDRIEAALRESVRGARITIHVEPEHKSKADGMPVK